MKIQKEFTDDHQVKVTAEFEPELLEQFKHKAARKIAQRTRIPGFRPGKAPYAMVLTHVGEASIVQEAIELMLDKVYPDVLEETKINPYGPGNLDAVRSENPPVFEFTIPLEPEVELGDVESLRKEYTPGTISDDDVDEFIDRTRRNAATIVPIDSPTAEGNVVYITLEAEDLEPEEGKDPIIVHSSPQQILIPTKDENRKTEWPYEGFGRLIIGHMAGENLELTFKFSSDHEDEVFRNKKVLFRVNIQSVKALELPELNEEYLATLGEFKTVEELKKAVRERLEHDSIEAYDDAFYLDLVDQVRKDASIKYPPKMLAQEEEEVLHRIEHDLSHRQLDLDVYLKIRKTDRDTFINDEVKPTALNRLERSLIMETLSKKFDIKIENEQLEHEINKIVNELVMSGELNDMQKEMGAKKFANTISMEAANRAFETAIRNKLKSIASPESITISDIEILTTEEKAEPKPRKKSPSKPKKTEIPKKSEEEVS